MTTSTIVAHPTNQQATQSAPSRFAPILCACGRRADIWVDDTTAVCGKCFLALIGDEEVEAQP